MADDDKITFDTATGDGDVRLEFAACRSLGEVADTDTFVLDGNNERLCYVPEIAAPWNGKKRTADERWEIASRIAAALNG